jgi:hypothetical protein
MSLAEWSVLHFTYVRWCRIVQRKQLEQGAFPKRGLVHSAQPFATARLSLQPKVTGESDQVQFLEEAIAGFGYAQATRRFKCSDY